MVSVHVYSLLTKKEVQIIYYLHFVRSSFVIFLESWYEYEQPGQGPDVWIFSCAFTFLCSVLLISILTGSVFKGPSHVKKRDLKVLTNEKRGGSSVVSFDRS